MDEATPAGTSRGGAPRRPTPDAGDLAALAVALALFAAGRWVFRRLSPHVEDFR
jgi:flagellar biogenesis protein FliO